MPFWYVILITGLFVLGLVGMSMYVIYLLLFIHTPIPSPTQTLHVIFITLPQAQKITPTRRKGEGYCLGVFREGLTPSIGHNTLGIYPRQIVDYL
jgi:hypothetical protein